MCDSSHGYAEGEVCGRDGCQGTIALHPVENCACHIAPPCSACTSPRAFCPVCGWEEADDPVETFFHATPSKPFEWPKPRTLKDLDSSKIDWISSPHSTCSMIKEGVFPVGKDAAEVRNCVEGTFGGRFEYFDEKTGKFKYIAYTD